jgi:hypothetical protein
MTFLEALQSHKGGLIRLKGRLFWYGGRGWDGVHDRICLLMDSVLTFELAEARTASATAATAEAATTGGGGGPAAAALLLIDGCLHWVLVGADDLELL